MTTLEYSNTTVSFKDLANKLSDNIQVLRLDQVHLEGSEDDMLDLMKDLRGHPSLKEFSWIKVTADQDLDMPVSGLLIAAPCIEKVHIEETKIRSASITTVSYCATIKTLELPRNGFTDADASAIADALGSCAASSKLETVDLSGNDLSDAGGKALELCLEKNTSLRALKLDGNKNMSGDEFAKIKAKLVGRAAVAA